jgi:prevent-host-death family protein
MAGSPPFAECAQSALCTLHPVTIPLTQASRMLGHLITDARISGEPVTITVHGRPVAELVPLFPVIPEQRQSPESEE